MINLKFPAIREVGNPKRKLVNTREEFLNFVNTNNGKNNLYTTVYYFEQSEGYRAKYDTAVIDKIFFDFDPKIVYTATNIERRPDSGHHDFITVFNYCLENDIKCLPILTGNGYQLYIETIIEEPIKNKKALIYNAQTGFIKTVNKHLKNEIWGVINIDTENIVSKLHTEEAARLKAKNLGERYIAANLTVKMDHRTLGKTDQLGRIPFTYNLKCNRYCIPLHGNLLRMSDESIKKVATDKSFVRMLMKKGIKPIGNKLLDITKYNTEKVKIDSSEIITFNGDANFQYNVNGDVPACMQYLFKQDSLGWDYRRIEILWLRDNGYLLEEVYSILKKQLTKKRRHGYRTVNDYEHCISQEDGNQPLQMFKREDLMFPTWESLRQKGICPFKNKKECTLNKLGCMLYNREE